MNKRYEKFDSTISVIERTLQKIKEKEMQQFQLKGSSVRILTILNDESKSYTAADLSRLSGFDKAHISRILKELSEKELIRYESEKKYATSITLTKQGKQVSDSVLKRIDYYVSVAGKDLNGKERVAFYNTLEKIAHNLELLYGEEND